MKSNFPDTPLAPVNLEAARMLSVACDDLRQTPFYLGLMDEAKSLDADIISMEAQLASHRGEKNEWFRQCSYSLELARKHRQTVNTTMRNIASMAAEIASQRRKEAAHIRQAGEAEESIARKQANLAKQERLRAEKQAETEKAQARRDTELARLKAITEGAAAREEARRQRMLIAASEQENFLMFFKQIVKEELGMPAYLELIEKAKQKMK